MTAYKAMAEILNINDDVEYLKSKNNGNQPNKRICGLIESLENYKTLLMLAMLNTELNIGHTDTEEINNR